MHSMHTTDSDYIDVWLISKMKINQFTCYLRQLRKAQILEYSIAFRITQNILFSRNIMLRPQQNIGKFVEYTDPRCVEYNKIGKLRLSDDQLQSNQFPRNSTTLGFAYLPSSLVAYERNQRKCDQCKQNFDVDEYDKECVNQCVYHRNRKTDENNRYNCCKKKYRSPGCTHNYHVTAQVSYNDLSAFISTPACDENYVPTEKDIFALDCEMCYTVAGMELISITVVDIDKKVVYETFVKPNNRVIDYNTAYSGISAETLRDVTCTLHDVQDKLRSIFHSNTILIGHSLESDLKSLKLVHSMVVDTSVLYPHEKGPPMKRRLKALCWDHLKLSIQNDGAGHSSLEDAKACIDLVLHYVRSRKL